MGLPAGCAEMTLLRARALSVVTISPWLSSRTLVHEAAVVLKEHARLMFKAGAVLQRETEHQTV